MSNQSNIQIGKDIKNKQRQEISSKNNLIWWVLSIVGGVIVLFVGWLLF